MLLLSPLLRLLGALLFPLSPLLFPLCLFLLLLGPLLLLLGDSLGFVGTPLLQLDLFRPAQHLGPRARIVQTQHQPFRSNVQPQFFAEKAAILLTRSRHIGVTFEAEPLKM